MEENKNQISIDLNPEIAKGQYTNLALISHSASEFILDFAENLPGMPKPTVVSRMIMTPEHAKRLLNALADNVSKYENNFGTINLGGGQPKGTINLADLMNGAKS